VSPVPLLRAAQARHPDDFWLNYELGRMLEHVRQWGPAVGHYRAALALRPSAPAVHNSLGVALLGTGRVEEAVGHYRQGVALEPANASAHYNLGNALRERGRLDEAAGHLERAVALAPKLAQAHNNLANALVAWGRLEEAVGHYEQALQINPKYAGAHNNLSEALLGLGRLAEARDAARRCLDLLPQRHALRARATRRMQRGERLLALGARLPAVLQGEDRPADAAERLDFAVLCRGARQYAAAAGLYADAFAADPKLADLRAAHRYDAARSAAVAAAGRGAGAPKPDGPEGSRLRRQALGWLRADLAAWVRSPNRALARRALVRWQRDAGLAGVRDERALAALPSDERAEWDQLWAGVAYRLWRLDAGQGGAGTAGK
jgi:tetratricopeptide (TPR) repeat protein